MIGHYLLSNNEMCYNIKIQTFSRTKDNYIAGEKGNSKRTKVQTERERAREEARSMVEQYSSGSVSLVSAHRIGVATPGYFQTTRLPRRPPWWIVG